MAKSQNRVHTVYEPFTGHDATGLPPSSSRLTVTEDRAGYSVWLLFITVVLVVTVALTRTGVSESIPGMVTTVAAVVGVPLLFILRDEWNPRWWRERRRQREEGRRRVAAAEAARAARRRRPCATMN